MINQQDVLQHAGAPAVASAPPRALDGEEPNDKPAKKRSLSKAELYVADGQANNPDSTSFADRPQISSTMVARPMSACELSLDVGQVDTPDSASFIMRQLLQQLWLPPMEITASNLAPRDMPFGGPSSFRETRNAAGRCRQRFSKEVTQSRNLPTYFFSFWAFATLAKAFAGNKFGLNPRGYGLNSGRAAPHGILLTQALTHHQPWLGARSGRPPARAAQHSLRLLPESSFGKTLAATGSTRLVPPPLQFSKPGAHGLAADLATGGPTGPPGI